MKDAEIKGRIAKLVKISGGNQSELARKLGVKRQYLSMILTTEQGVSSKILFKFGELGVNMNWIMFGKGEIWQKDMIINAESESKIIDLTNELEKARGVIEFAERVLKGDSKKGSMKTKNPTLEYKRKEEIIEKKLDLISSVNKKINMEKTTILRKRMKQVGVTLKSVAYLSDESEQTVCRILNQELNEKIHEAGNKLVKEAGEKLIKELTEKI